MTKKSKKMGQVEKQLNKGLIREIKQKQKELQNKMDADQWKLEEEIA